MQIPRNLLPAGLLGHVGIFYLHRVLTLCFPLLLLPILAHRLTTDAMGHFFVLQAWGMALSYLLDFGFTIHGARMMANEREHTHEIGRILSAQILLFAVLLPVWLFARPIIPVLREDFVMTILTILLAASTAITPNWYFWGRRKMTVFVAIDVFFRLCVLAAIAFLPYDETRFALPYAFITFGQIFTCAISLYILRRIENFRLAPMPAAITALRQNWRLCLTEAGLAVSVSFNTILLSLFAPPALIAAYGVAEKIIRGCGALLIALTQALYPHFSKLQRTGGLGHLRFLVWAIGSNFILTLLAFAGIWVFAPSIIPFLTKTDPREVLNLIYWLTPTLFLFGVQATVYMHGLLASGDDKSALYAIFCGLTTYTVAGLIAVTMQSAYAIITAQTVSLLATVLIAMQKKNSTKGGIFWN